MGVPVGTTGAGVGEGGVGVGSVGAGGAGGSGAGLVPPSRTQRATEGTPLASSTKSMYQPGGATVARAGAARLRVPSRRPVTVSGT